MKRGPVVRRALAERLEPESAARTAGAGPGECGRPGPPELTGIGMVEVDHRVRPGKSDRRVGVAVVRIWTAVERAVGVLVDPELDRGVGADHDAAGGQGCAATSDDRPGDAYDRRSILEPRIRDLPGGCAGVGE